MAAIGINRDAKEAANAPKPTAPAAAPVPAAADAAPAAATSVLAVAAAAPAPVKNPFNTLNIPPMPDVAPPISAIETAIEAICVPNFVIEIAASLTNTAANAVSNIVPTGVLFINRSKIVTKPLNISIAPLTSPLSAIFIKNSDQTVFNSLICACILFK